jgi:hypothetical protein
MPLYLNAEAIIKTNLQTIAAKGRPTLVVIGEFSDTQFDVINAGRLKLGLHEIASKEIVFIGRHVYASRTKDRYIIDDIWKQIESALSSMSVPVANSTMTALDSIHGRADGYGNTVYDRAIFECTQRKPRAELFSVIPKGDNFKPKYTKSPP